MSKFILNAAIFLLVGMSLYAQTLPYDHTFGQGGVVKLNIANGSHIQHMALQPDGKIVLSGIGTQTNWFTSQNLVVLARLLQDGTLDASFGQNGIVELALADSTYWQYQDNVLLTPSGSIVLTSSIQRQIVLHKLDSEGKLDPNFDGDGTLEIGEPGFWFTAYGTVLLDDQKMLLQGEKEFYSLDTNYTQPFLCRLLPNGSPDQSFGVNGFYYFPADQYISVKSMTKGPDNMLYFSGSTPDYEARFFRTDLNGLPDDNFNDNFTSSDFFQSGFLSVSPPAFLPDGKFVLAGDGKIAARFNADGSKDPSFGKSGYLRNKIIPYANSTKVLIDPKGKILVDVDPFFNLAKINPNGTFYYGFDYDGILEGAPTESSTPENSMRCTDFLLQPDGKIIMGGYWSNQFYVARF